MLAIDKATSTKYFFLATYFIVWIILSYFIVLAMTKPNKSPATTGKKKTTVLAKAKNSTRKLRNKEVNLDGSFLTASGRTTVSTDKLLPQNDASEQSPQHDAIMAYL